MRRLYLGLTDKERKAMDDYIDKAKLPITVARVYEFIALENKKGLFNNCIVLIDRVDAKAGLMIQRTVGWND